MYNNYSIVRKDETKKQSNSAVNSSEVTSRYTESRYLQDGRNETDERRLEMARHINRKNRMKFMHLYQLEKHFR